MLVYIDLDISLLTEMSIVNKTLSSYELREIRHSVSCDGYKIYKLSNSFGVDILYYSITGGITGHRITNLMESETGRVSTVPIRDESKNNFKIIDYNSEKIIGGIYPRITTTEKFKILERLLIYSGNDNVFCCKLGKESFYNYKDEYTEIFKTLCSKGEKLIIQCNGISISEIISFKPYLLIVEKHDLEEYFKIEFENYMQIVHACGNILSKNIPYIIVRDGTDVLFLNYAFVYRVDNSSENVYDNKYDNTAIIAGIGHAMDTKQEILMSLKLTNAFHNVNLNEEILCYDQVVRLNFNKGEIVKIEI